MKLIGWTLAIFAAALSAGALSSAAGAQAQIPYDQLPKIFDATVPSDQQITLALSAGPAAVRDKATVYVLGPKGYEKAREGTNGVSCLVGRHFVKPTETTVEPMCYDPEGTEVFLPVELYREELRIKGTAEADIKTEVANAYKDGRFKPPTKPGVLYMLSGDNRLGPTPDHNTVHVPGHFMFYAPFMTGKDFGYDSDAPFLVQPGSPSAKVVVFPDPNLKGTM
jgi:hypothetical protein